MKTLLAVSALVLLAAGSSAMAQDRPSDYANMSNQGAYNQQTDRSYDQAQIAAGYGSAMRNDGLWDKENLLRIPGAPNQPGDPDAVTDNHTATNQPPLGTAGSVPAVSIPNPADAQP